MSIFFPRSLFVFMLLPGLLLAQSRTKQAPERQIIPLLATATVAELQREVQRAELPDTLRVIYWNRLAYHLKTSNIPLARRYLQQAIALAQGIHYVRGIANATRVEGDAAITNGDLLNAQTYYLEALRLHQQINNYRGIGDDLMGLGNVATLNVDYLRALRYFAQADSAFKRLSPRCLPCELLVLGSIANRYEMLNRFAEADQTNRRLLALTNGQDDTFSPQRLMALNGIGTALIRTGKLDSAIIVLQQGIKLANRTNNQYLEISLLNTLTEAYEKRKNALAEVEYYAQQAVKLGWASGQQGPLKDALNHLATAMYLLKRPAAYDTLQSYVRISERLQAAQQTQALADAQTRYDVAGQQAQINNLQKDRRLAAQKQELTRLRNQRTLIGLGGLALVAGLVGGGLFWQYRRRQAQRLADSDAALRQGIAADLHDDVGNLLTQISLQSDLLSETNPSPAVLQETLHRLSDTSRRAVRLMADAVWGLHAAPKSLAELLHHMRDHANEVLPAAGLAVDFAVTEDVTNLNPAAGVMQQLYLIYKEALHNAVKHAAGASRVIIRMSQERGLLHLFIHDDAPGPAPAFRADGRGLANMRQRAESVGGTFQAEAGEKGFAVRVSLPV